MTPDTIDHPTELAEWLEEYAEQLHAPGGSDGCDPSQAFLLIEENIRGGYWLTTHDSPAEASEYHDGQEYAGEWLECQLVDLTTGAVFLPATRTGWVPYEQAAS